MPLFSLLLLIPLLQAQPAQLPRFENYPVTSIYRGPTAPPKLSHADEMYRKAIHDGIKNGVNFAARSIVVQLMIGNGPLGVILVDARTGTVLPLPKEVVGDTYFVANTRCLAFNEGVPYLEREDTQVLSFTADSELMIIRRDRICKAVLPIP